MTANNGAQEKLPRPDYLTYVMLVVMPVVCIAVAFFTATVAIPAAEAKNKTLVNNVEVVDTKVSSTGYETHGDNKAFKREVFEYALTVKHNGDTVVLLVDEDTLEGCAVGDTFTGESKHKGQYYYWDGACSPGA